MAKELFLPYRCHLPQHIQGDSEEDEAMILRSDMTFEDLIADGTKDRGLTLEGFHSFIKKRVVFITPDTAIYVSLDAPSHHKYAIDVTFTFSSTTVERALHISGVNAEKTSPALNFLLRLILEGDSNEKNLNNGGIIENKIGVIFKCFSMTPRQQLGSLDLPTLANLGQKRKISSLTNTSVTSSHKSIDVEFRFFALNKTHCKFLFNEYSTIFSSIKLSQCQIDEWATNEKNEGQNIQNNASSSIIKSDRPSQKLVLSCSQQEFRKFAQGQLMMSNETSICELNLLLHFMLSDMDVHHLGYIIEKSQNLKSLKIEFLEIDDKTWTSICKSLHNNRTLKGIKLAYTERFADSFRRLTPQRRHSRTNDILQLLNTNKTLQEVCWPKFQQDESLMSNIKCLLTENKHLASLPS